MKATYTSIPVDLCQYALINNRVNHLKLFLYLKTTSSGHISMKNYNLYSAWASDLELSERTIRNLFKWLIKNKWLTVNSKRVSYRIISYKQLNRKFIGIDISEEYCKTAEDRLNDYFNISKKEKDLFNS